MAGKDNNFVSISSCVFPSGVSVQDSISKTQSIPQYKPCNCANCGDVTSCDCVLRHGCAYNSNGKLKECYLEATTLSDPVIECSRYCSCDDNCPNKISQKPPLGSIYVDKAGSKGHGVFTKEKIKRGTYICEYVGEMIKMKEYEERLGHCSAMAASCYAIKFREHVGGNDVIATCIDARCYGNIARFVNHSCSPNMVVVPVRSECLIPRICLFASKDVDEHEELCFSYCDQTMESSESCGKVICLCGSSNCRGFLPLQT